MRLIAYGVTVRLGNQFKRLWFEIPDNENAKERFDILCREINGMDSSTEWKSFLKCIEAKFDLNGFFRIAK